MAVPVTETPLCDQFWEIFVSYNNECRLEPYKFPILASSRNGDNNSVIISKIESLIQKVETLSIFSRNDTLDDIPSSSIKFLLLPFILAQCLENIQDLNVRRDYLLRAKKFYGLFCVTSLSLLHDSDPEYSYLSKVWDNYSDRDENDHLAALDQITKRQQTIDRRNKINSYTQSITDENGLRQQPLDESSERNCFINLIKQSFLEAIITCELIDQEVELLRQRANKEKELSDHSSETIDLDLRLDGVGAVLKKPFIIKIANKAELRRYFQSRVFQPSHILPSISLQEAAEYDMRVELGLQEAQKRTLIPDEEEEEIQEEKQRAWDDWKDNNPRGSGNKMTNRG